MTTTHHFQKNPDYYMSIEECKSKKSETTNPRYPFFKQTIYTAGDVQQFETYRDPTNGNICIENIDVSKNLFADMSVGEHLDWEKYQNLTAESVDNTFNYMFHKLKKGLFIKIKNGKLDVYLPFSKVDYINEWGDRIKADPTRFRDITEFFKYVSEDLNQKEFNERRLNKFTNSWFGNNCLLRTEFPIHEGDASYTNFQDMFKTLCERRQVPDCEFFLNKRDFPYIKLDSTEPYDAIFDGEVPLLSHNYKKYSPILGMVTTDKNADIPMPTWEDWARVSSEEHGKIFDTCRTYTEKYDTPWEEKKPIAVFRGSSTGCGSTPDTNPRIKLSVMGQKPVVDPFDGLPLIDTGVTSWNLRPRKESGINHLTTIEVKKLGLTTASPLSPLEQSKFKYIINVDGHVSAYRLSLELRMGSVILLADSPYRMWFRKYLIPYYHYVPIKADLSDLYDQIMWCKSHDAECKVITENAKKFYYTYLTEDGILDFMQMLLINMKRHTGVYLYNWVKPMQQQISEESKILESLKVENNLGVAAIGDYDIRGYGYYRFIEGVINGLYGSGNLISNLEKTETIASSRTSEVVSYKLGGFNKVLIKWNKVPEKINENIHDAFVSIACLNELLKEIPNFVYTFGLIRDGENIGVVTEKVRGMTLHNYIKSEQFSMDEFIDILIQLNLAIKVAQNRCGLVHWDLYPWNIMINQLKTPITVEYAIDPLLVYQVRTKIVPVIIDYGKSHVIYNSQHHGYINPYQMNIFQDSFTLLITAGSEIMQKQLKFGLQKLMTIFNWITESKYIPKKFGAIRDLKEFLFHTKKYSSILNDDKKDVGDIDPLAFVDFLVKNFRTTTIVTKSDRRISRPVVYSELTFVEIAKSEPITAIEKIFRNISGCEVSYNSRFYNMYTYYKLLSQVTYVIETIDVLQDVELSRFVRMKADEVVDNLKEKLTGDFTKIEYKLMLAPDEVYHTLFSYKDFYNPERLERITDVLEVKKNHKNYIQYRSDIVNMLLSDIFNYDDQKYLWDNFQPLIECNPFYEWSITADIGTLRHVIKTIIKTDIKNIKKLLIKEDGDCTDAENILKIYEGL